ncbi:MAG TPA: hypothetical protein PLB01_15270 [Thermoanaerobaculia bacterium]|nr:hypothetical protein [Thermoanaerobaculia bacterium]
MQRVKALSAALLLALVAAAAVLPLVAAGAARGGCHCAVRMACCEDGTCMMGGDEQPADGPEWRTCRREAPAGSMNPLDSYERALKSFFEWKRASATASLDDIPVAPGRAASSCPATPPPRLFSF